MATRARAALGDRARGPFCAIARHSWINSSFLAQASTEAQGPWDSNYQIEDDFSWFVPGKKGDHELKFGVRYNYTELQRVSQINENGTFRFNTDLSFDAANARTYPERLTIRMGEFEERLKTHTFEAYAQDKWKMGERTTLSIGLRYDLENIPIDVANNPLFSAGQQITGRCQQLLAAHRHHARARRGGSLGGARRLWHVLQPNHPRRH